MGDTYCVGASRSSIECPLRSWSDLRIGSKSAKRVKLSGDAYPRQCL